MAYLYSEELRQKILAGEEPPWISKHIRAVRVRQQILSTPVWADREALHRLYRTARRQGKVVDHIIPVTHPLVCGLTVPANLRLISKAENNKRSNRWWEFTPDMFSFEQQLRLW